MSILAFAAPVRRRTFLLRVCAAFALLSCVAARTQAADFTVGGSITNLAGSGLVLRLDAETACIASGNISAVTNSPASGGPQQCQNTATSRCCSESSSNFESTVNGDGTINCTVICGQIVASVRIFAPSAAPQQVDFMTTQTLSPPAHAASYVFGTAIADGSTFTAGIDTQPSNPAQVCALANATGAIAGANVANVDVTCTTVTHMVTATAGANGSAAPPSQSVDDGSSAIVTLAPAAGFMASASGCGGSLGGDGVTYTTAAITADCTVAATFARVPAPVSSPALGDFALAVLGLVVLALARRRVAD